MRVLVTGASGFLGLAVVEALAAQGHQVSTFGRSENPVPRSNQHTVGDLLGIEDTIKATENVDAVYHLAALTRVRDSIKDPIGYWRTNTCGTVNLLNALVASATFERPKRIVLASTAAIYGQSEQQPISETAPLQPINPYGASKLAADHIAAGVAATGLVGAISLRAFNIAGGFGTHFDGDTTRLIPKILAVQAGRANELAINGDGSAVRDFVHVQDMADPFALSLTACTPGSWRAYNLGSGRRTSVNDVVKAVETVTGRPVPTRHNPAASEPQVLLADPARIQQELGWQAKKSDLLSIVTGGWTAVTRAYSTKE